MKINKDKLTDMLFDESALGHTDYWWNMAEDDSHRVQFTWSNDKPIPNQQRLCVTDVQGNHQYFDVKIIVKPVKKKSKKVVKTKKSRIKKKEITLTQKEFHAGDGLKYSNYGRITVVDDKNGKTVLIISRDREALEP